MTIDDITGSWHKYVLSPTGKSLTIYTERGTFQFCDIRAINILPASDVEQGDPEKEIYQASAYTKLESHHRASQNSLESYGVTVEVGPPTLLLRLTSESRHLKNLLGFFIDGDYFSVTLICQQLIIEEVNIQ